MKSEKLTDGRWITVHGNHVFIAEKKKIPVPKRDPKPTTHPFSRDEIKERSANELKEARKINLTDALKEKYSSGELKAKIRTMYQNSIARYGDPTGNYGPFHVRDATDNAITQAEPGTGRLFTEYTDEEENDPLKAEELNEAKMIAKYLGGDVIHLKERGDIFKVDNLKTADLMHNGHLIDIKKSTGGSAITGRVRDYLKQAQTPTFAKYGGKFVEGKQGAMLIALNPREDGKFVGNKEVCSRISGSLGNYRGKIPNRFQVLLHRGKDDLIVVEFTKG